jgi:hypothetical protein
LEKHCQNNRSCWPIPDLRRTGGAWPAYGGTRLTKYIIMIQCPCCTDCSPSRSWSPDCRCRMSPSTSSFGSPCTSPSASPLSASASSADRTDSDDEDGYSPVYSGGETDSEGPTKRQKVEVILPLFQFFLLAGLGLSGCKNRERSLKVKQRKDSQSDSINLCL